MTRNEPEDRELLDELAGRLQAERPLPAPGFRGELGRMLASESATAQRRRQPALARLRVLIGVHATSGTGLLALAFLGVVG
nr:hypothetical protein [Solirubrobacterales bacterium]